MGWGHSTRIGYGRRGSTQSSYKRSLRDGMANVEEISLN